jgi:hypothetical protein
MGPLLQAQTFTYVVSGTVMPCAAGDTVHLLVTSYTQPDLDTVVSVDPLTCQFTASFTLIDPYPTVLATLPCNGSIAQAMDSALFSFPDHVLAYDSLILDCGGVPYDCYGFAFGPNLPGTPCEDGNPTTTNEFWSPDCICLGDTTYQYDCLGVLGGTNLPGTPCDDLDSLNINDLWGADCGCHGEPYPFDCFGVPSGPAMPGSDCDDGDPLTIGDFWTLSCVCMGYPATPCGINFQVVQALAYDSLTAETTPIPNTLWAQVQSTGAWPYSYLWDFGDDSFSTEPYPTHTYAGNGPYELCVTITDAVACSSTTCDTVSVDSTGMIIGMVPQGNGHGALAGARSGFTIQILPQLPSAVPELTPHGTLSVWPNPATDRLTIAAGSGWNGPLEISILALDGRLAHSWIAAPTPGNSFTVDLGGLPPGSWLLRINAPLLVRTVRFVKAP